jgi:RNA methyltransferase, TrmH family
MLYLPLQKNSSMLTNQKIKWIKSLEQKKFRKETGCFVVEGEKMVNELLKSRYKTIEIYATSSLSSEMRLKAPKDILIEEITEVQLERISQLKSPNKVLAVAELPSKAIQPDITKGLSIMLDNLQDPGNLGTIIRTAAWFGIGTIYCSPDTVDVFNPKVVQSTMGALFNMNMIYHPLDEIIQLAKQSNTPVYGTHLNGENIYKAKFQGNAIIIMGNESQGLSEKISRQVDQNLFIPTFPAGVNAVESLNVSVAMGIVCAEFRRQNINI